MQLLLSSTVLGLTVPMARPPFFCAGRNPRACSLVALDIGWQGAESWADLFSQANTAATGAVNQATGAITPELQKAAGIATQEAQKAIAVAAPEVEKIGKASIEVKKAADIAAVEAQKAIAVAAPEVEKATMEAQKAIAVAAPGVEKAINTAAPEFEKIGKASIDFVVQATPVVVGGADKLVRTALTAEQQAAYDGALRVGGQIGEVTSAGLKAAAPVVESGLKAAAPVVESGLKAAPGVVESGLNAAGRAAEQGAQTAAPLVDDLIKTGAVRPETAERVKGGVVSTLSAGVREVAAGLRTTAELISPESGEAAANGAVAARAQPTLVVGGGLKIPTVREGTDSAAASLVAAAAPYALGLWLLSLAVSALQELVKPLAEVVQNAVTFVIVLGSAGILFNNWDTIYGLYEVASGQTPLKLPF